MFVEATGAYATWPAAGDTLTPATTVGPTEKWAQIDETHGYDILSFGDIPEEQRWQVKWVTLFVQEQFVSF